MKKVVIIGGGFVGSTAAKKLQSKFKVTLVDSKEYFEFTPSVLRTLVKPTKAEKIQVMHKDYLKKSKIICGKAKSFNKKEVVLEDGKKIPYDYLVIGVGSSYGSAIKAEHAVLAGRANVLQKNHGKLKKAKDVAIIGGGLVGVELAAEIVEFFPEKKLTILHGGPALLERNPKKAQKYAEKFFKKKKVKILFEERMTKVNPKSVVTETGKRIDSDLTFLCIGISLNSAIMKNSYPKKLTKRGAITVDKYLRVKGFDNVLSGGDITDIKEEKTAQNAGIHGELIAKNILAAQSKKSLTEYQSETRPMVISLGKYNGIFVYKGKTLTGLLPGLMKFIPEWKTMRSHR